MLLLYVLLLLLPACSKERMDFKRAYRDLKVFEVSRYFKIIKYEVNKHDSLHDILSHVESIRLVKKYKRKLLSAKSTELGAEVKSSFSPSKIISKFYFDVFTIKSKYFLLTTYYSSPPPGGLLAGFGILGASTNYVPELIIEDEGKRVILDGTVQGNHYRYEFQAE